MQDMRGKVKKKLVHLNFEESPNITSGDDVHDMQGAVVGSLRSVAGSRAIASIESPAFEPKTQLVVGGNMATVTALR